MDFVGGYDAAERLEVVFEAFTMEMRTMQLIDTTQDMEYVERRLGELENELASEVATFQEELQEAVGEEGRLQEAVESHVGKTGRSTSVSR